MVKSRRGKHGLRLFSRVWAPAHHVLKFADNAVGTLTNTAKGVLHQGLKGVNSLGASFAGHANGAIKGVLRTRKRKGSRKTRKNARKGSRKSRR